MRYALWIALALVTLVIIILVVGWVLPVTHEASRSANFSSGPEAVYAAVADVESYPTWWPEVARIEMLASAGGRVRFREHTSNGPLVMEIVEASPPSRFVTRIADEDQPFGGTWTFEISPQAGGSILTITERGEIYNPIFRVMSRFVFGYTSTMESYLDSLQKRPDAAPTR
jgi:hypothetical protein